MCHLTSCFRAHHPSLLLYRISPPICLGLIRARRAFLVGWWAYPRGGAYTRCKKMFCEEMTQNSQFASLNSESNIIFDNNLHNTHL